MSFIRQYSDDKHAERTRHDVLKNLRSTVELFNHMHNGGITVIADSLDRSQDGWKLAWGGQRIWFKKIGVKTLWGRSGLWWHDISEAKSSRHTFSIRSMVLMNRALELRKNRKGLPR